MAQPFTLAARAGCIMDSDGLQLTKNTTLSSQESSMKTNSFKIGLRVRTSIKAGGIEPPPYNEDVPWFAPVGSG